MVTPLKREAAGRYRSPDGRFTVEQGSSGWMLTDGEQVDDLGLPLVRGPFATLEAVRAALETARSGPAPRSDLADRIARRPRREAGADSGARGGLAGDPGRTRGPRQAIARPMPPPPPPVVIREYRSGDGDRLRALWAAADFTAVGDDDASLRAFAQRNPGTFLVALQGGEVVGSALGGWDGRRGWIYHVTTAQRLRRSGLGRRLVRQIEDVLRARGCRKVNVIVRDGNTDGTRFWEAMGYVAADARQLGRRLDE